MKKHNIMIGPSPEAKGGISAVITQYRDNNFFDTLNIIYLTTHTVGSKSEKIKTTILSLFRLLTLLMMCKVNVIHIHTASYRSFYRKSIFAWLSFLFHRPVIFHIHGGKFINFLQTSPKIKRRFLISTLYRSHKIISLSQLGAQQLQQELGEDCPNITVLANPIASKKKRQPPTSTAQRILFLGDIKREKGVYDLVDALDLLKSTHPQLELFLGGVGEIDELTAYAQRKGVCDRLNMLGWIDAAEKEHEFQLASVFVLPSYAEGQPMTILEAMSSSVPIIASNVGGIPEMLKNGTLGQLIDAGQPDQLALAIAQVLREKPATAQKVELAYSTIKEQYSPQVICGQIAEIYRATSS